MKILSRAFWSRRKQAAATPTATPAATPPPIPLMPTAAKAAPAPTPAAVPPTVTKESTPQSKPSTHPKAMLPTATKTATAAPAVPQSHLMHRAAFEALSFEERNERMAKGLHIVDMKYGENPKDAAARAIEWAKASPESIAVDLLKGFSLGMADAEELMKGKFEGKHDKDFNVITEARIKDSLAKAEKSRGALGYLLPGAQPVDDSRLGQQRMLVTYKKPGEVSEPERLAAEKELVRLFADFEKITEPLVRSVWWERNRDEVFTHARNETRRGSQWPGIFIAKLSHMNLHVI